MSNLLDGFFEESEAAEVTAEDEKVEPAEVEAEPVEKVETEAKAKDKPEPKEEPTSPEEDEKQNWTLAAVKDERQKRQEAQKRIEELERKLAERDSKQEEIPDVFEDQKAFVESIRNEQRQELQNMRLEMAREFMMEAHKDYEEMEAKFIELAKENPVLKSQAQKASNPAKFAYQQAKKYAEWQEMQDIDTAKQKLRAELREELKKELEAEKAEKAAKTSDITPSLAKARASDKGNAQVDDDLGSLLGNR